MRLQLHVLAYNLGNFMRTLAMPKAAQPWSLTSLREKLIKIGAKVVSHGRYVWFQMAEVAVPRQMFVEILSLISRLRAPPRHEARGASGLARVRREVYPVQTNGARSAFRCCQLPASIASCPPRRRFALAQAVHRRDPGLETAGYLANVG